MTHFCSSLSLEPSLHHFKCIQNILVHSLDCEATLNVAGGWGWWMRADSAYRLVGLVWRIQITHFQGPTARGLSDSVAHACVEINAC